MATERNYYCLCDDNNKFLTMTKEQIVAAIAEATGTVPSGISVDDAFITTIKEQNKQKNIKVWVGTQAEYNALATKPSPDNTIISITDDETVENLEAQISAIQTTLQSLGAQVTPLAVNEYVGINTNPVVPSNVVGLYALKVGNIVSITGTVKIQSTAVSITFADAANVPPRTLYIPVCAVSVGGSFTTAYCIISNSGSITFRNAPEGCTVYVNVTYGLPN